MKRKRIGGQREGDKMAYLQHLRNLKHQSKGFHDNSSTDISSTTLRPQTFRLQIFRLLLYTSVQDSDTSNFCFSKSSFSSISTSTYSMIPFYQSHFHLHYDNTTYMYIVGKHCGMKIQLVLSAKDAYFYQSHFYLGRIPCINPGSIDKIFVSSFQLLFQQGKS